MLVVIIVSPARFFLSSVSELFRGTNTLLDQVVGIAFLTYFIAKCIYKTIREENEKMRKTLAKQYYVVDKRSKPEYIAMREAKKRRAREAHQTNISVSWKDLGGIRTNIIVFFFLYYKEAFISKMWVSKNGLAKNWREVHPHASDLSSIH